MMVKVAVVGTVGLPANYGGFETLVKNLVEYHHKMLLNIQVIVYCSSKSYASKIDNYLSSGIKYVPLRANGIQSVLYDIWSLFSALRNRSNVILLLGVSGAIVLPIVKTISSVRIVTNLDGVEWQRKKWSRIAKIFLKLSEILAVRFSDVVIADNSAIADYVNKSYSVQCVVIEYGGDHAVSVEKSCIKEYFLPKDYAISICRIEPENNCHLIVDVFSRYPKMPLAMIGNWNSSEYGRNLRMNYSKFPNLYLLDPIYDLGRLKSLRGDATLYIHGHSAGGTNPSLVEAMHFGKPILAFDCIYNRATTENKAIFFANEEELMQLLKSVEDTSTYRVGADMLEIARRRYMNDGVSRKYFDLLTNTQTS